MTTADERLAPARPPVGPPTSSPRVGRPWSSVQKSAILDVMPRPYLALRHRRSRLVAGALAALLAGLPALGGVGACRAPTEITIELTTDVRCTDVKGTAITIGDLTALDSKPVTTVTPACDPSTGRIGSMVIVPSAANDDIVAIKVVMGVGRDPAECVAPAYGPGCIVARRALHFIPSSSLYVPIFMGAICTGIACNATQTCVGGNCASAVIEDSSKCEAPGGCSESSLGATTPGGTADSGPDAASTDAASDAELPVPIDLVVACGRPSTYLDDFEDGIIAPEWVSIAPTAGSSVAETGGRLVITTPAGATARLESRFTVNLAGDRLRIQVPAPPTAGTSTVLAARAVNGDELAFVARNGMLAMRQLAGTPDETLIPYDPIAHRWWQIVEAGGQIRWETSPDATTWTMRKMIATPAFAPAVRIVLESTSAATAATAGEARFDRLNAGRPRAPWCQASTLVDDFNDGVPGLAWTAIVQGACSYTESGGEVRFTMTGAGPSSLCAYSSTTAYDLRSSAVYIQIPAITSFFPPVRFFLRVMDASARIATLTFVGSATPQLDENATGLTPQATNYSAAAEGWWRLREAGGSLFWETSTDGLNWNVKRQAAAPFPLDAVRLLVGVETSATMAGSISIGTPRLNIGPP